jgi:LmbE family N-acetylglucosaminyl deacetylase
MRSIDLSFAAPPVASALVLGAHSDDAEIGAGGTIRLLRQRWPQAEIRWVVFASAGTRADEAMQSALAIIGDGPRHAIQLHEFRDGFFPYDGARLKEEFERLKAVCNPDIVFTHHGHDYHQDHRTIAELTWNTFRDHLVLEYEVPKYDGGLGSPNFFVPLPIDSVEAKVEGLMRYFATQRAKNWFTEETFRSLMRIRGIECRADSGYAEAFYARKAVWSLAPKA